MVYRTLAAAVMACWLGNGPAAAEQRQPGAPTCALPGSISPLPELHEASGLAAGRRNADLLWSHNDSGSDPVLFAFHKDGTAAGKVAVNGAAAEDWEALSIGPCGKDSCLFIGDIGDNDAKRAELTIYRLPEPEASAASANAEAIRVAYPDGAHNAEGMFVTSDGSLVIVTKGDTGAIAVYKAPSLPAGEKVTLQKIGTIGPRTAGGQRITDAAISNDGEWVVLRSRHSMTYYPAAAFLRGEFRPSAEIDLRALREPQGEGIAFGAGGTLYVAGEGGGRQRAGTLAVLSCR